MPVEFGLSTHSAGTLHLNRRDMDDPLPAFRSGESGEKKVQG